ncbi:hypothetical protein C0989_004430, partial [Termitomyces sp. Mn162]
LTSDKAPLTSIDPVKAYIDLLPHGEEPVVLTVAKDSQSLCSIMMLIDNKEETLPLDMNDTETTFTYVDLPFPTQFVANKTPKQKGVQVKKKYKPVAMKTKPVTSHISKDFQIKHQIIGNPLATILPLNPNLPPFIPTKQFTSKQQPKLVKDHDIDFLTSNKIKVLVDMVTKQEKAFAWEDSK